MRISRTLTRVTASIATVLLLGAAAACGESGTDSAAPASNDSSGAFPVTIEHARGSTTIESEPQRVVTIGYTDHEPLLALGVTPVGVGQWWGSGMDESWPWVEQYWKDQKPTYINTADEVNYELIASLEPDLILALYADVDEESYSRLTQIAPTVAQSPDYDAYTTPWTEMTLTAGKAVGKQAEAEKLIADTEAAFATVRQEHPEFAEQTATVVNLDTPEGYVFASGDPRGLFMTSLGFQAPADLDAYIGDAFGEWLSNERFDLIDLDRILVMADTEGAKELDTNTLYQGLSVVKDGRAVVVPYTESPAIGAAMSYNTVLSIPYAIDEATERLTAG
ncbi:iron-siderophore ABC transporter substrate-binding protein [Rhodococcoides yunnanense]|uniref:iron-siderophore ABC transporter substrate-binding protein n=1 Tax=Rhodococcoides yunnanense TaxID=278209 RepID=UPI0009343EBA|nr:iron-siderophore ABC transporter substrate-binding protein [Rhodococcus yunnanensis]